MQYLQWSFKLDAVHYKCSSYDNREMGITSSDSAES